MISISAAGTVGKDAELKYSASGTEVLQFSIACDTGWDSQKKEKKTTWLNCTMFGKRAETLSPKLTKGTKVTVYGFMEERRWEDDQGGKRSAWSATIDNVDLQGGGGGNRQQHSNTDGNWNG